ncbi:MAG: 7-cyano-7-deazaguanine synthase QueC [Parvibaculum sp.]
MSQGKALVLFSGGQDSTVCLASALARFDEVETVGFDYGQTHIVELNCRTRVLEQLGKRFPDWKTKLGADHMLNLRELSQISETALTRDMAIEMDAGGLPNTFVPGRNLLFFVYAAALGYRRGATTLVGGMCETDYSGYPDCRNDTLQTLAQAVSLGMARPFTIDTPLMYIDKAETWALADRLGGQKFVDLIIEYTHTCYRGDRTHRHDWGYGCNDCPACELRANGYAKWRESKV